MKNVVLGMGFTTIMVLVFLCLITISGQATRAREASDALPEAVETAVEKTMSVKDYAIDDNKEFVADFMENLLSQITNDSDVEVKIAGVDYENGLLGIKVIQHYNNPNGKEGKQEYETTVLFTEEVPETKTYTANFYVREEDENYTFASYQVTKGEAFIKPTNNPRIDGKTFKGWMDLDGNILIVNFPTVSEADKEYVAVFE